MEQNRGHGNESTRYADPIFDKDVKNMMQKRQPLQKMLQGKLDIKLQKTEIRSMFIVL
jgi:hypothetical protein